jgi:hypothetical protein
VRQRGWKVNGYLDCCQIQKIVLCRCGENCTFSDTIADGTCFEAVVVFRWQLGNAREIQRAGHRWLLLFQVFPTYIILLNFDLYPTDQSRHNTARCHGAILAVFMNMANVTRTADSFSQRRLVTEDHYSKEC